MVRNVLTGLSRRELGNHRLVIGDVCLLEYVQQAKNDDKGALMWLVLSLGENQKMKSIVYNKGSVAPDKSLKP